MTASPMMFYEQIRQEHWLRDSRTRARVTSGAALRITRELISQNLDGQDHVARYKLLDTSTADTIARLKSELPSADSISSIRLIESQPARARVATTQRHQAIARWKWSPSSQPDWLNDDFYKKQIQSRLSNTSLSQIALALGVSIVYASDIRRGRKQPPPRHWQALAELVGLWK